MVEIEILSVKNKSLCKVQVDNKCTIADLKKAIQNQVPKLKISRQSIREDVKGKDMSNSENISRIRFANGNRLFVKDLGPQISWTIVFLVEYFGPLVVYALFATQPSMIYGQSTGELSYGAKIAWACWSFHYAKRLFETLFIHRFSHGTMPLRNLFKNCSYYWGFAAYVAYHVNHPLFTQPCLAQVFAGLGIFVFCELGNLSIHILLRNLRPAGSTVRKIPHPTSNPFTLLFNFVSCPNYTYEYGAWLGFTIMTSCIPSLLFAAAGMYQMTLWALGKHRNYKKEFKDYPRSRKSIVPFII